MGLDMYLEREVYICHDLREKGGFAVPGVAGLQVDFTKVNSFTEEIGYWRKANQIHQWFVDHCNDGDDNNGDIRVEREQLQELLTTVDTVLAASATVPGKVITGQQVTPATNGQWVDVTEDGQLIADPQVAKDLLPTAEGFFFGSTEYDQFYLADLHVTKAILERALALPESIDGAYASFVYRASW